MIVFTAELRVIDKNRSEFEAALNGVARNVREHEPGTLFYGSARSIDDPECYITIEVYRDEKAYEAHRQHAYMREANANVRPLLEAPPFVKRYQGF
jgi:quinol monooxygenase YgiN